MRYHQRYHLKEVMFAAPYTGLVWVGLPGQALHEIGAYDTPVGFVVGMPLPEADSERGLLTILSLGTVQTQEEARELAETLRKEFKSYFVAWTKASRAQHRAKYGRTG